MLFKLETTKHQRTAIQSVVEALLYPSFGALLVLLWSFYRDLEPSRGCDGDLTEVCASGNICSSANEAGFVVSCTYVREAMNLCSCKKDK